MTKIIEVEGIGETFAKALHDAGVPTIEALLESAASPQGRQELAAKTGVSPQRVLEWVNRADLMRINGVGSEFSDLLEHAGVDTVKELARSRADNLHAKLEEINDAKHLVRRTPSTKEVERWVQEAKTLPAKVTHGPNPRSEQPAKDSSLLATLGAALSSGEDVLRATSEEFARRRALLDLISEAAETFGGLAEALVWLRSPNRSIGDATPESLLEKGAAGIEEARTVLFRLEDGMFS
jgi:predicted flap endonuclease-1-like 5' DNA nuclease